MSLNQPNRFLALALMPFIAGLLLVAASPTAVAAARPIIVAARPGGPTPGYDISYPQCGTPFPTNVAFGIVGVNKGIVFSPNPCLGTGDGPSELTWGGGIQAQLYASTGNPGPALSTHWPNGQTSPRECNTPASPGSDTLNCAYDYGWNAAADSYQTAVRAYISLGLAAAGSTSTPTANVWWLDVETSNSWRSDVSLNVAALQGAVAYLQSAGAARIGFYSTQQQWDQITGGTLAFAAQPSWVAGASSARQARNNCSGSAFTGAGVELAQYFAKGFDADLRC
ncbi:MAG: hypothetical protein ACXWMN_01635 [Candidatus Limnocylindria bacterium]